MNNFKALNKFEESIPMPMFRVDTEGKISKGNSLIGDVFIYDSIQGADIFALTGIKYETLKDSIGGKEELYINRNDKIFKIMAILIKSNGKEELCVYFIDVTELENLKAKYEEEKTCIAVINIDNYDELNLSSYVDSHMTMISEIDKAIRKWAEELKGSVIRQKENIYSLIFTKGKCDEEIDAKFPILDSIRDIDSEADFPITLSIGVGINGESLEENDEQAQEALDLALGRGGDQVVVKDGDNISYFGGKAKTVEKGNKGKSRIIGHALKRLIQTSSKVFIMGHKNPDMDAFGSAMGISRLSTPINKDTYIVLEKYSEALDLLFDEAKVSGDYSLITRKRALELIDDKSIVIMVDTHKPSITECPELLEKEARIVVIDHHRKDAEFVENPTLVYVEPYASSTSELVTEILQYTVDRKEVTKLEAEGLLAGIFVDTNHFSVKTGVRTFEAAAWLRRAGADLSNVKRMFQVDKLVFMDRLSGISNSEFKDNGVVYSMCPGESENSQMICSIVADELLTIRGVRMVFAVGSNHKGKTIISARSIGARNVQILMERFGGGGHLNAAGAQTNIKPDEVIKELKKIVEEEE